MSHLNLHSAATRDDSRHAPSRPQTRLLLQDRCAHVRSGALIRDAVPVVSVARATQAPALPSECWSDIFMHLDVVSLQRAQRVCRAWHGWAQVPLMRKVVDALRPSSAPPLSMNEVQTAYQRQRHVRDNLQTLSATAMTPWTSDLPPTQFLGASGDLMLCDDDQGNQSVMICRGRHRMTPTQMFGDIDLGLCKGFVASQDGMWLTLVEYSLFFEGAPQTVGQTMAPKLYHFASMPPVEVALPSVLAEPVTRVHFSEDGHWLLMQGLEAPCERLWALSQTSAAIVLKSGVLPFLTSALHVHPSLGPVAITEGPRFDAFVLDNLLAPKGWRRLANDVWPEPVAVCNKALGIRRLRRKYLDSDWVKNGRCAFTDSLASFDFSVFVMQDSDKNKWLIDVAPDVDPDPAKTDA